MVPRTGDAGNCLWLYVLCWAGCALTITAQTGDDLHYGVDPILPIGAELTIFGDGGETSWACRNMTVCCIS